MSRDLSINVNINPNGVASPTETKVTPTPQQTQFEPKGLDSSIKAAAIVGIAQRGIGIAAANIGQLTGNSSAQRKTAALGRVVALGYAAFVNPAVAGAALAFQVGTDAVQRAIENRNVANEVEYNRILRTATYNNGRK